MKPLIEITKGLSFGGWEGGAWNTKFNVGRAVLIAGADAAKLKVIYSHHPNKLRVEKYHFLFIMEVGHLMAQAYVTRIPGNRNQREVYDTRITLSKVTALRTNIVQGHPVADTDTVILWAFQGRFDTIEQAKRLDAYESNTVGYRKEYKEFMQAALAKATTLRENQDLFWGQPRQAVVENV